MRTVTLFVLALLMLPTLAVAAGPPLTLVQLTDLALQRNTKTRLAWDAFRASQASVDLARAGYWPQVTATLDSVRSQSISFSGLPARIQTRYGASVSLSYLLWDFGTRNGLLDQAKFQRDVAGLSRNQTLQDVILLVEQSYYQVLGLKQVTVANRQSLTDAETNLDAVRERRVSGLATVGDVYTAEAAEAGARLTLQQSEGQLASARGQLAVAIGDAPDSELRLADWKPAAQPQMPAQSASSLMEQARTARADLLAAKAQERAAAANLEATRGRGLPSLSLNANTGRTQVVGIANSSQFSAGVSVSIPIFSGFGDRAAIAQAQAQVDSAQASDDDLRSQVELQVWQAYQNLRTAVATLGSSAAQLNSAQQAADVARARYQNGLDSILDLMNAQNTLANARVQQVQARLNWASAQAALGHAVGGLRAPSSTMDTP